VCIPLSAAALVALVASTASASGLFVARFGGEHGHPTTDNPTAVYYNPAGLALGTGTRLMLDGTFAWRTASYKRDPGAISNLGSGTPDAAASANSGTATLANPAAAPFIGVASDLGIEGLGVGLAFFVPIGGAAAWDKNDEYADSTAYPGAQDSVARWWSIEGTMRALYLGASAAYRLKDLGLSVGLSINGIKGEAATIRARHQDGTDDLVDPNDSVSIKEGRSEIDASGYAWSLGAGVVWEPKPDMYVGVGYQSRPNLSGGMEMEGTLRQVWGNRSYDTATVEPDDVVMTQDLADVVRLGFRMKLNPKISVRAAAEYAFWSALERQCVFNKKKEPTKACTVDGNGQLSSDGLLLLNLERQWRDAYGFRAGASYHMNPKFEIFAGAGWDGSAVPDEFMDPALFDLPKVTASAGARYTFAEMLRVTGTFTQVTYFEVDTTGTPSKPSTFMSTDSKGPSSAGAYNQAISVFNLSVEAMF